MTFGYAAPLFIGQKDMKYSTWLTGLDDDWSDWTAQTSREYINLPPGSYTFKVRAQNVYGDISEEASVPFSIDYPWYRSWWAYALYLIGFLAIIWMAVKARTGILLNQQKVLEDRVEERTREVQQRLNELATVNSVSQALNDKLELSALIQLVGKKMKDVFNSDITYLAILDEETNVINFVYQDGDEMPPMQLGEGLTSRIIQSGEPLLINRDTDIMAEYNKHGIKQTGKQAISYLGVPIPVEDKIIGVLSVQSTKQASRFTQEDKKLLTTIAINVGVALHNADLYEQAREAKARAEDANEAKSAFLSTVSHELRTPLDIGPRFCEDHPQAVDRENLPGRHGRRPEDQAYHETGERKPRRGGFRRGAPDYADQRCTGFGQDRIRADGLEHETHLPPGCDRPGRICHFLPL